MADMPRVSVVCLSYNRPHLLVDALTGIAGQSYPNLDVTIIDNRSPRSTEVAQVAARFPHFRFVANPHNDGFAAGMNLGVRSATGDFICLTEDDLVLAPDYVATLVEHCLVHPNTGLVGGLLINRESGTILCAGADYRLGNVFHFRFRGEGERDSGQYPVAFPVAFVSGSVVFAPRSVLIDELNGFRDDFFLYFEDLDLAHRASRIGRAIMIVPQARAYHAEPPPGPPSAVAEYHKYKNLYTVYLLYAPGRVLPVFLLRYGPWALAKSLFHGRFRDFARQLRAWVYVLPRVPQLLAERKRGQQQPSPTRDT